ncbi:DddA-like double-stranded DNA deaminase toxin [Actinokineospora terrae]|uniref:DddA-like double-stranded DNA deaminase toxin n=1 Tax=Actinokineospora terrae TaxID=155974 RepID=UPI001C42F8BD|nr:DddA-like double-stranded DNA deaminase toxin [Actinokineospora terrae]
MTAVLADVEHLLGDAARATAIHHALGDAEQHLRDLDNLIDLLEERLRAAVRHHGGALVPARTTPPGKPTAPSSADWLTSARAELPADVVTVDQREPGAPTPKTHGRWVADDGLVHAETSGKDDKYTAAVDYFRSLPGRRVPLRAPDVEMKLAVHMRLNGITTATLVINHVPCLRHDVACVKWMHRYGGLIMSEV